MSIESVRPFNHVICRPLLLLPSIFPSIGVFSSESTVWLRWPEYWSFSISPSSEYSGLISFRIDWFDLLAVKGTLKSLLQHHSSKASVLWHAAFFMIQLSHVNMTTAKTIALTRWTFVSKVMVGKIHWRRDRLPTPVFLGFPCGSAGKESACNAGELGSIPGWGRSRGRGHGNPF